MNNFDKLVLANIAVLLVFSSLLLVQVNDLSKKIEKNSTYTKELRQDFDRINQPNPIMFPHEIRK